MPLQAENCRGILAPAYGPIVGLSTYRRGACRSAVSARSEGETGEGGPPSRCRSSHARSHCPPRRSGFPDADRSEIPPHLRLRRPRLRRGSPAAQVVEPRSRTARSPGTRHPAGQGCRRPDRPSQCREPRTTAADGSSSSSEPGTSAFSIRTARSSRSRSSISQRRQDRLPGARAAWAGLPPGLRRTTAASTSTTPTTPPTATSSSSSTHVSADDPNQADPDSGALLLHRGRSVRQPQRRHAALRARWLPLHRRSATAVSPAIRTTTLRTLSNLSARFTGSTSTDDRGASLRDPGRQPVRRIERG